MNNRANIVKKISFAIGLIILLVLLLVFVYNSDIFKSEENVKENTSFVEIIDVGQGDSILISSEGYSALIDTGIKENVNEVCNVLKEYKIKKLDTVIITHLDNDHSGGLERLCDVYEIDNLILPEISVFSEGLENAEYAIAKLAENKKEIYTAVQGMNFKIGKFTITVLASFTDLSSENDRSIITMAEIEGKKFLFTGDMEAKAERLLLKEGLNLKCDVLKVSHHGSSGSTTSEFLAAVRPKYAAISVGKNSYGHPHNNTLARLEEYNCNIYRTDLNGNIIFKVSNSKIQVATEK